MIEQPPGDDIELFSIFVTQLSVDPPNSGSCDVLFVSPGQIAQ